MFKDYLESGDINVKVKVKVGKIRHGTGQKGPEGDQRYSSTLSITLVLDGGR
jgi:hypothetical protein